MNNQKYAQPFSFANGLTLKNRFLMAPMTTKMSFYDGVITQDEKRYYHMRSKEVGAVITAAANVSENGKGWDGELGVYDDKHLAGLSDLASSIKVNGTKAILQLYHGGRMTHAAVLKGVQPVAPSSVRALRADSEIPRELKEEEILQIIEDFKAATVRAIKAGFDGVELHGANTYLIQQFFSPHSNRRTDQWGGSMENRFTFIDKLVDAVTHAAKKEASEPFIVGYRFSPEEIEIPGIRFNETLFLIEKLCDKPLDYLHVSLRKSDQVSQHEAYQDKPMITYLREHINGRIPFIAVGDVRTGEDAETVLQDSELVALGRVLLADPNWVSKVYAGKEDLIRYDVAEEDRDLLGLTNGVWGFMQGMMPDRLK
ncbi:MAG: NADH-dependent flavin oxidoreductase [Alkalibacterium sp.]|uniref:NADH-dependent flavin oxidoreductase n=1 Tax=Alkalibacterium sp. TaxID=1872447 RepID=UPI003970C9FD